MATLEGSILRVQELGEALSDPELIQTLKTVDDHGIIVNALEGFAVEMAVSLEPTQAWIKQFGTSSFDSAIGISTSGSANIYVTGRTDGSLLGNSKFGLNDAYLSQYDSSGNQQWVKQLGSSGSDISRGISIENNLNIYVVGYTDGSLLSNSNLGSNDAYLAKYDASGNQLWVKQFGSSDTDFAQGISIDISGYVYVAGSTLGSLFGNSSFGDYDAYVAKYDVSGNQIWIEQFGTSDFEYAKGISSDNDGNVYVTGFTYGVLADNSNSGLNDAYIAKYDASGNQVWIKQFGTSSFDEANEISTDSNGNIYITGYIGGEYIDGEIREKDFFIAKYDKSGNQVWIKQSGASETDEASGVSIDSSGNVFVTGYTEGSLLANSNLGGRDAFVAKYDASGNQIWVKQFGTSTVDEAEGISTDSNGNVYVTGSTFGSLPGNTNLGSFDAFIVGFDTNGNLLNPSNQSVLSINDLVIAEGDRGITNATFTVTRTGIVTGTATVDYLTVDGTATVGSDYVATIGSLTFAPNETSKTITVGIIGDLIPEYDEVFFINLKNATNATVDKTQGVGTIVYPVPISDRLEGFTLKVENGRPLIIDGFVGALIDGSDGYYYFILQNSIVNIKLTQLSADANLFLYGGWPILNTKISSTNSGNADEIITYALPAGTHYIDIASAANTEGASYKLEIKADPILDFAGNTLAQARDIGDLRGTQTFTDYVGGSDRDYYRFELRNDSQVSLLGASLERLGENILLFLLDSKGNQIDRFTTDIRKNLEEGVYFVGVYGKNTYYNVTFFANANVPSPFRITGITPVVSSNSGESTITVKGDQFTTNCLVSIIAPDGTESLSKSVKFQDQSTLTATFDLVGLTTGAYDVKVLDTAKTAKADDIFQVNIGNPGKLDVFVSSTSRLRPWGTGEVTVTYRNSGDTNIIAPLLTLKAEGGLFEDSGKYRDNTVQFLAINPQGDAGVLSPGATGTFSIRFRPESQFGNQFGNIIFTVDSLATDEIFDWNALQESSRPESIPSDAWTVIFNNFFNEVEGKAEKYEKVLAENATRLSELGERTGDVSKLLAFELQQVNSQGIFERFNLGSFGRGLSNPWDITATANSDGDVTIQNGGSLRFFEKLGNVSYKPEAGDNGVITLENGVYRLQEQDGTVIAFRTDGKLDFVRDTNSNQVTAGYTTNKLTTLTYTNGDVITFAYNNQGRITNITDFFGQDTTYTYDGTGERLLSVTDASGTISYTYETGGAKANAIKSISFPDGTQTFFEYDEQGRVTKQSLNGDLESVTYGYDSAGGVTVTDAQGNVAKLLQNASGQVSRIEDSLGRVTEFRYDKTGNLTRIVAPENNLSSFNYDSRGNLLSATDPLGQRVEFTYDQQFDQIQKVRDQRGNDIHYTYDAQGNLGRIIYTDGSREAFSYNSKGDMTISVNRRGEDIDYTYDSRGLLTKKVFADGTQATFIYDSRGNLTKATDADSNVTYAYDSANRLTQVSYGTGRSLTFAFDAGGRRTQMVDQDGFTTNYQYDAVGRFQKLTDGNGANIITYAYDSIGLLAREDNGNGTYTTYSYDVVGQLSNIVNYQVNNTINSRFDYSYDSLGRRTSSTTLEGKTTYSYDATGQLTSVVLPNNRTISYEYDAAGNRISVKDSGAETAYSTNNLNQYTNVGSTTYTYDKDGNLIAKKQGSQTWNYRYDTENRLVGVVSLEGTWRYEYDALGNRIASIKDGQRTEYLLDPTGLGAVVGEYSSGNVARYTHGLGLVSRVDGSNTSSFYDTDAIGSVVGLSGMSGSYLNSYSYLPFGEDLTKTEAVANPFEFVGQYGVMDEGNGLDFMRARFYTSVEGRFMNLDPIGIAGGLNLYNYTKNSPSNLIDPSGLCSEDTFDVNDRIKQAGIGLANAAAGAAALYAALGTAPITGGASLLLLIPAAYSYTAGIAQISGSIFNQDLSPISGGLFTDFGKAGDSVFGGSKDGSPGVGETVGGIADLPFGGASRFLKGASASRFQKIEQLDRLKDVPGRMLLAGKRAESIQRSLNSVSAGNSFLGTLDSLDSDPNPNICPPGISGKPQVGSQTTIVLPIDPNDIIGPSGFGDQNWLTPSQILPYTIRFENQATATAAAVFITITHTLDADLDLTTFELGDFGFGDLYIDIPDGFQSYTTRLDLQNTIGDYVDFAATLNPTTRTVTWTLTTIDPATGEIPDDVDAGFLPPNNANHDGEGFVNYRINAKANLSTGAVIDAEASIVFDTNEPIKTPAIFNTIDFGQPASAINALPETVGENFAVTWGGNDDGSGIASYDIFVSVNGGIFTLWQDNIAATSATYTGDVGKTYAFYSVAKDGVGYTENAPLVADAKVTVVASNKPPVLSAINKSGDEDASIAFTAADFSNAFADADADILTKIKLVSLPASGSLTLNGVAASVNQEVVVADLGQLRFDPDPDFNGSLSFEWTGFDGKAFATPAATVNLAIASVNDAPNVLTAIPAQRATAGTPFRLLVPDNAFRDGDVGDALTYSATLANGDPLPGWLAFEPTTRTFSGTPAQEDAASLRINIRATDRAGASASLVFVLAIATTNQPPFLSGAPASITYTELSPATAIDPSFTLADPDAAKGFAGGFLEVAFTSGGTAADRLSILDQGTSSGQIGVLATKVIFGGSEIGQIDPSADGLAGSPLRIAFAPTATLAAIQALGRAIAFSNSSNNPSTTRRTLSFRFDDGGNGGDAPLQASRPVVIDVLALDDSLPPPLPPLSMLARLTGRPTSANALYLLPSAQGSLLSLDAIPSQARLLFQTLESSNTPDLSAFRFERRFQTPNFNDVRFFEVVDSNLQEVLAASSSVEVFQRAVRWLSPEQSGENRYSLRSQTGLSVELENDTGSAALQDLLQDQIANLQEKYPVLDFRSTTGPTLLDVSIGREAGLNSSINFYRILDADGTVLDPITGALLRPGASGYGDAALHSSNRVAPLTDLNVSNNQSLSFLTQLDERSLVAPLATVSDGQRYFAFAAANPDGIQHWISLGANLFGLEDLYDGGDRDFDDAVIAIRATAII